MSVLLFRKELPKIKTLVVKTGSRILTAPGHEARVRMLVEDLATLRNAGVRVVLVSSGAIAHGMAALGLQKRPQAVPLQQACASVGQNRLMHMYQTLFSSHNVLIGQVLLTWDDLRSKKRYLNLRNTMFQLLDRRIIPIVNENDSVGIEEIQFGNNDTLGAQVSLLVQADLFVNLTDVGGLYDKNPRSEKDARHIPVVPAISAAIHKMAGRSSSEISVGGMSSKLKAAEMVTRAGIYCLIGDGFDQRLTAVMNNESCATLFPPSRGRMTSRHRWIAFTGHKAGTLVADEGAQRAIVDRGKSLLPAGIREVKGAFKAGDMVEIQSLSGQVFARGLVNYAADEVRRIAGHKTSEISSILEKNEFDEVIHRDNLVLA